MLRIVSVGLLPLLLLTMSGASAATGSEIKLWVVEASKEGREKPLFDAGLESIQHVLAALPHDTYRKLAAGTHGLSDEGNSRVPIVSPYTLEAGPPVGTRDGRYRLKLRILMKSKNEPAREIEALSTELVLQPDKQVLVRGLKGEDGHELLLVLSLTVPPAKSQS